MGIFSAWQPLYAEHGIATFPVLVTADGQKKPAVCHYGKMGMQASRQLAFRFPNHDAIGFMCGRRSRITVLDVDTPDDHVLADALANHGATPLIVRSGRGKFHAYYRHNGENRQVRQHREGWPIDLCGGGVIVGSPSKGANNIYEIIHGRFDDIQRLPVMHGLEFFEPIPPPKATVSSVVGEGERNVSLWRACMRRALKCGTLDDLLDFARTRNEEFGPPLPDAEVMKVAESAWGYTQRGENWFGRGQEVRIDHEAIEKLTGYPDAVYLLLTLKRHHEGAEEFVMAKAMASSLGLCVQRFLAARALLEKTGSIRCLRRGGKGKNTPPIFGWP